MSIKFYEGVKVRIIGPERVILHVDAQYAVVGVIANTSIRVLMLGAGPFFNKVVEVLDGPWSNLPSGYPYIVASL